MPERMAIARWRWRVTGTTTNGGKGVALVYSEERAIEEVAEFTAMGFTGASYKREPNAPATRRNNWGRRDG